MPVNITMEFVQQLMEQNTALLKQNAALTNQVDELTATVKELKERKERLNKNSKNSSKPPSSDGLKKQAGKKNWSLSKCPLHGGVKTGAFPENIKATVQYGKNLQAMVVAFNTVGAVMIESIWQ